MIVTGGRYLQPHRPCRRRVDRQHDGPRHAHLRGNIRLGEHVTSDLTFDPDDFTVAPRRFKKATMVVQRVTAA
jgi:hypothetical protein